MCLLLRAAFLTVLYQHHRASGNLGCRRFLPARLSQLYFGSLTILHFSLVLPSIILFVLTFASDPPLFYVLSVPLPSLPLLKLRANLSILISFPPFFYSSFPAPLFRILGDASEMCVRWHFKDAHLFLHLIHFH
jgi:hypothetical protein